MLNFIRRRVLWLWRLIWLFTVWRYPIKKTLDINGLTSHPAYIQGGQSRGQHNWVHGFPEPVKSFINFVILSRISCSKVQPPPPPYFSAQDCVKFLPICCSFPDYLDQLKKARKILRDWVYTSVGRSNLEICSEPRRNVYIVLCRKM